MLTLLFAACTPVKTTDAGDPPLTDTACDGACDGETDDDTGPDDTGPDDDTGDTGFAGAHDLGAADARVYGPTNHDLGRFLEVGDLTGDGVDDVLAATLTANAGNGGGVVIPGPVTGEQPAESVGIFLRGGRASPGAGRSIGVGDVNGDGFLDVSFGSPYDSEDNGTWILFGPFDADRSLTEDRDVYLRGPWGSMAGHGGDLADLDGDGVEDALVGCWSARAGGPDSGSVFVKYGPLPTGDLDLTTDADAELVGETENAQTGRVTRAGADLDGDGLGDMLALAPFSSEVVPSGGAAYVVYGPPLGTIGLSAADGRIHGADAGEAVGFSGALGDVNGDGLGDVVVGALPDRAGSNSGAVYVVFGPAAGDTASTAADIVIDGIAADQWLGAGAAVADIDGDGVGDLLAGALNDASVGVATGGAFLFLAPAPGAYTTADADAVLHGEHGGDLAGMAVALGDLDDDGWGDLLVGAPSNDVGGSAGGAVYVLYAD